MDFAILTNLIGLSNFSEINGIADLNTSINFNLDNRFKIKNPSYSIDGDIAYLEIHTDEKRIIKNLKRGYS